MIKVGDDFLPHAAYLRVLKIGNNADVSSSGTWATLDDLGTVTKDGTDTIIEQNGHDVLVFRKDGTIRLDKNEHPANREGYAIIAGCTEKCTPQGDGEYIGESGTVYKKDPAFPGTCYDQSGDIFLLEDDIDNNIRVWTTYYQNRLFRNLLEFNVSYSETVNTYENEKGRTIQYPVRVGKRKISLKVETNLHGLAILKDYFSQNEFFFFFRSTTDEVEQNGTFRKTSDIQIQTIANEPDFRNVHLFGDVPNSDTSSEYGEYVQLYLGNDNHTGAYEFSASLEEV